MIVSHPCYGHALSSRAMGAFQPMAATSRLSRLSARVGPGWIVIFDQPGTRWQACAHSMHLWTAGDSGLLTAVVPLPS